MRKISELPYDEYLNVLYGMMEYKDNQPYFPCETRWDWCKKAEEADNHKQLYLSYDIEEKGKLIQVDLTIYDGIGDNKKVWQKASCQSYVEENLAPAATYDSRNYSLRNAYLGALDTCLALRGYTTAFLLAELRYAGILKAAASPGYEYPVASQDPVIIENVTASAGQSAAGQNDNEVQENVPVEPQSNVTAQMVGPTDSSKSSVEEIVEAALSNADFGDVPVNDNQNPNPNPDPDPDPAKAVVPFIENTISESKPVKKESQKKAKPISGSQVQKPDEVKNSRDTKKENGDGEGLNELSEEILSYRIKGQCSYKGTTIKKILDLEPKNSIMIYLKWVLNKAHLPEYADDAKYCQAVYEYLSKK